MSSRRFFLSEPPADSNAVLVGEEAHHLAHVLRAEPGRIVELIDGSGKAWRGVVRQVFADRVVLEKLELLQGDSLSVRVGLVQSLCKADKLEWILQKTTELGASDIYLLEADRSVMKVAKDKIENKMDRWQKIILAAAKQSRRSILPVLHPPAKAAAVSEAAQADLRIILSENERSSTLKNILRESGWKSAVFCIGPEGGWTNREEEIFSKAGFRPASLGSAILRTETAAIVATALLKYELENG